MLPAYENPLDLLLDLVRQHKVPIAELPLAPITTQYLDYMHHAERLDINLGIDFAHTAAILIQLKSKALLPHDPLIEEREREQLIRQLLTHEQARKAAETLAQKKVVEDSAFGREPAPAFEEDASPEPLTLWELTQEFRALARQDWSPPPIYVPEPESVSVGEMMEWVLPRLSCSTCAEPLLAQQPTLPHRIALFLGLLELARSGRLTLSQHHQFGPIEICALTS